MIGVDTNLLVRILTNDDPIQLKLIKSDDIFIPKTKVKSVSTQVGEYVRAGETIICKII